MYVRRMIYRNVGPVLNLDLSLPFHDNGNPKPVIFVGENGSGKSIVLSNIADSLYEIAQSVFSDIRNSSGRDSGYNYLKTITPSQITLGQSFMCSYIELFEGQQVMKYIFKSGTKKCSEFAEEHQISLDGNLAWGEDSKQNFKKVKATQATVENAFETNSICYFPPVRYERPSWLSESFYYISSKAVREDIEIAESWNGQLGKPIMVVNPFAELVSWIIDVIIDSRGSIRKVDNSYALVEVGPDTLIALGKVKEHIDKILSIILGKEIKLRLYSRNAKGNRLQILDEDNNAIVPTLNSLSTGQLALFELFATIVRYTDIGGWHNCLNLGDISGIIIIDEIDLHLHSVLQSDVLPKLMKLFPKVQFIVTSHSPLFLLGMEKEFGADGYEIINLPDGNRIDAEEFSLFQNAYEQMIETRTHKARVQDILSQLSVRSDKPLIVTEGSTDWKHMKAALNYFRSRGEYNDIDFEFLEYEPENASCDSSCKLQMSNTELVTLCKASAKLPQSRILIFIADRDAHGKTKDLTVDGAQYRKWNDTVYSLEIPVPKHRTETPLICIEHLYSDSEIKSEFISSDGISRRIYMACDFDQFGRGVGDTEGKFCKVQSKWDSIHIIDGTNEYKVVSINTTEDINYALPKADFAKNILSGVQPSNTFTFEGFRPLFDVIAEIIRPTYEEVASSHDIDDASEGTS